MISCGISHTAAVSDRGPDYFPPCRRENNSRIMELFSSKIVNVANDLSGGNKPPVGTFASRFPSEPLTEIREYWRKLGHQQLLLQVPATNGRNDTTHAYVCATRVVLCGIAVLVWVCSFVNAWAWHMPPCYSAYSLIVRYVHHHYFAIRQFAAWPSTSLGNIPRKNAFRIYRSTTSPPCAR